MASKQACYHCCFDVDVDLTRMSRPGRLLSEPLRCLRTKIDVEVFKFSCPRSDCRGLNVFARRSDGVVERVFPDRANRALPESTPSYIASVYSQALAVYMKSLSATAFLIRHAVETILHVQYPEAAGTIDDFLKDEVVVAKLSPEIRALLNDLRRFGNVLVHYNPSKETGSQIEASPELVNNALIALRATIFFFWGGPQLSDRLKQGVDDLDAQRAPRPPRQKTKAAQAPSSQPSNEASNRRTK